MQSKYIESVMYNSLDVGDRIFTYCLFKYQHFQSEYEAVSNENNNIMAGISIYSRDFAI